MGCKLFVVTPFTREFVAFHGKAYINAYPLNASKRLLTIQMV